MPTVLLNLGFATNPADADRLNSPVSQQQLSASIVRTIQTTLQTP